MGVGDWFLTNIFETRLIILNSTQKSNNTVFGKLLSYFEIDVLYTICQLLKYLFYI